MKIQLSEKRIIPGVMTIWSHHGPEVDLVMDLQNLTFKPGSINEIYAFHVLDHFFPEEGEKAVKNWFQCMSQGSSLHLLNDDFEYLTRAYVGGDIDIELFNDLHNHPCQYTQKNIVDVLSKGGFKDSDVVLWYSGNPEGMTKKHYEFIVTAPKK